MFENTKIFLISDIFDFERGQRLIKRDQIKGKIPYISSTMKNNGVDNFISLKSKNKNTNIHPKSYKNCLTIANSGSVGSVFYHPYTFTASDHVTVLSLKNKILDFELAFFFTVVLNQKATQYSYNREISNERLNVEKITLPVDEEGNVDWDFIYNFVENTLQYKKLKKELSKFNYISENKLDFQINTTNWKWWQVVDVFDFERGQHINKNERKVGTTPFIGAAKIKNGVVDYIEKVKSKKVFSNCLGWISDGDGGIGYCFYHPYEFQGSSTISFLKPKDFELDDRSGLFFSVIFSLERPKLSFGYKLSSDRLENYKVKLPTKFVNNKRKLDIDWINRLMDKMV